MFKHIFLGFMVTQHNNKLYTQINKLKTTCNMHATDNNKKTYTSPCTHTTKQQL